MPCNITLSVLLLILPCLFSNFADITIFFPRVNNRLFLEPFGCSSYFITHPLSGAKRTYRAWGNRLRSSSSVVLSSKPLHTTDRTIKLMLELKVSRLKTFFIFIDVLRTIPLCPPYYSSLPRINEHYKTLYLLKMYFEY